MPTPNDYERATGVNEKALQCIETNCGHYFRCGSKVPHCPKCQSLRVRDIYNGQSGGVSPDPGLGLAHGPLRMVSR